MGLVAVCSRCCRLSTLILLSRPALHSAAEALCSPIHWLILDVLEPPYESHPHPKQTKNVPSLFLLLLDPASDENCHSDPTSTCQPLQTLGIVLSSEQVMLVLRPGTLSSLGTSHEKQKTGLTDLTQSPLLAVKGCRTPPGMGSAAQVDTATCDFYLWKPQGSLVIPQSCSS